MKILITLFFLLLLTISNAQKIDEGFIKIPESLHYKNDIIGAIVPHKKYESWEFIRNSVGFNTKVIFRVGKYNFKNEIIDEGFFTECAPDYDCFNYLRIKEYKKKQSVISNDEGFRFFLGKIDNLEEALLLIRTYDYWFDKEFAVGGSYKIDKDFIFIYCTNYSDYGMYFYKLKINRVSQEITIESTGKIDEKPFPKTIS